jgi:hypothetical protein
VNQFPRPWLTRLNASAFDAWAVPITLACIAIGACSIAATIYLGLTP